MTTFRVRSDPPKWVKNAADDWVQPEPIDAARVAAASTGQVVAKKSDGTLELITVSGGGGGSAPDWVNEAPQVPPGSADPADDEFGTGSSIDTAGTRFSGATAWQTTNFGSATTSITNGRLVLTAPANTGDSLRVVEQAVPGSTWRYRANFTSYMKATNYSSAGVIVRDSSGGKALSCHVGYTSGGKLDVNRWTNLTTFSSNPATETVGINGLTAWWWIEVENDGTNLVYRISRSGERFITFYSETIAAFIGTAPTHLGLFADSNNSSADAAILVAASWRRMA